MYEFKHGATLAIALLNPDGLVVDEIRADLKVAAYGKPSGEPVLSFAVEESDDIGGQGPGWLFTADGDVPPGHYVTDARIMIGETTVISRTVEVRIVETVTEAAS